MSSANKFKEHLQYKEKEENVKNIEICFLNQPFF